MNPTKFECIIRAEDGDIITNVLERGDAECSVVKQRFSSNLGRELSDERTGPECDDVHERHV